MDEVKISEKVLNKNEIKSFILRIDLLKNDQLDIPKFAEGMSKYFDRAEKRQVSNFKIKITKGTSELNQDESFDFVLVSESKGLSMTFSEIQNAFWIESSKYRDNSAYKGIINDVVDIAKKQYEGIQSKRIGLRYINEFRCEKPRDIGKIYGKRLSTVIKSMLDGSNQSRIIGLEEYNNGEYKMRLQYGIPNKFYPSVLSVFDLILDIDSYIEDTNEVLEWTDVIRELNHAAYAQFTKELNPKYLEELK